jgi:hypothetical protein
LLIAFLARDKKLGRIIASGAKAAAGGLRPALSKNPGENDLSEICASPGEQQFTAALPKHNVIKVALWKRI